VAEGADSYDFALSKPEAEPSTYKDLELEPRGGVEIKSKGKGARAWPNCGDVKLRMHMLCVILLVDVDFRTHVHIATDADLRSTFTFPFSSRLHFMVPIDVLPCVLAVVSFFVNRRADAVPTRAQRKLSCGSREERRQSMLVHSLTELGSRRSIHINRSGSQDRSDSQVPSASSSAGCSFTTATGREARRSSGRGSCSMSWGSHSGAGVRSMMPLDLGAPNAADAAGLGRPAGAPQQLALEFRSLPLSAPAAADAGASALRGPQGPPLDAASAARQSLAAPEALGPHQQATEDARKPALEAGNGAGADSPFSGAAFGKAPFGGSPACPAPEEPPLPPPPRASRWAASSRWLPVDSSLPLRRSAAGFGSDSQLLAKTPRGHRDTEASPQLKEGGQPEPHHAPHGDRTIEPAAAGLLVAGAPLPPPFSVCATPSNIAAGSRGRVDSPPQSLGTHVGLQPGAGTLDAASHSDSIKVKRPPRSGSLDLGVGILTAFATALPSEGGAAARNLVRRGSGGEEACAVGGSSPGHAGAAAAIPSSPGASTRFKLRRNVSCYPVLPSLLGKTGAVPGSRESGPGAAIGGSASPVSKDGAHVPFAIYLRRRQCAQYFSLTFASFLWPLND